MNLKEAMDLRVAHIGKIMDIVYDSIKESVVDNDSSVDLNFTGDVSNLTMRVGGYEVDSKIDKPALLSMIGELLDGGYTLKANIDDKEYSGDSVKGCISGMGTGCYRKIYIVISGWKE